MTDQAVALGLGLTIGRYEIVSVMGLGATGPLYLARDRSSKFGFNRVLKEFLPNELAQRIGDSVVPRQDVIADFVRARARFVEEGRKLCGLNRPPFVARAFEVLDANSTSYVVFEKVVGIPLEQRLADGVPLTPAEVESMLPGLLEGLHHIHMAGLIHGDLRPANIMLVGADKPRLVGFCGARYDSPKSVGGNQRGVASDIYGVAATLYRAISGEPPPAAIDRLKVDRYRPLVELAPPGFSADMLSAIDKGMALRAEDRPGSVATWCVMIWPAGALSDVQPADDTTWQRATSTMRAMREKMDVSLGAVRSRGIWAGAAAAALVIGVATGGVFSTVDAHRPVASIAKTEVAVEQANLRPTEERVDRAEKARMDADAALQAQGRADAQREAAAAQEEIRQADREDEVESKIALAPPGPLPDVEQWKEPKVPEGAPGLLIRARSGETLQALYGRVYHGVTPPPFASIAAVNPERVQAGDILTFPAPANGWIVRDGADPAPVR